MPLIESSAPTKSGMKLPQGADARSISNHYLDVTNSVLVKSYARCDGVGLCAGDGKWDASLNGRNLSDEITYITGFASSPNPALAGLRPCEWMLIVNYKVELADIYG